MSTNSNDVIQITPNTVITNSDTRRKIGNVLWVLSIVAGLVALFFGFFPELAFGTDVPTRAIAFVNSAISIVAGGFGLAVVRPNTPTQADVIPVAQVEVHNPESYDPGTGAYG